MNISEIAKGIPVNELIAEVTSKEDVREINKPTFSGRVCKVKIKDETGEAALTLWNEQVDAVNIGDKISLKNAWVNEFAGELQLSSGKFGTLEVVQKAEQTQEPLKNNQELSEDPINDEEDVI